MYSLKECNLQHVLAIFKKYVTFSADRVSLEMSVKWRGSNPAYQSATLPALPVSRGSLPVDGARKALTPRPGAVPAETPAVRLCLS